MKQLRRILSLCCVFVLSGTSWAAGHHAHGRWSQTAPGTASVCAAGTWHGHCAAGRAAGVPVCPHAAAHCRLVSASAGLPAGTAWTAVCPAGADCPFCHGVCLTDGVQRCPICARTAV